MQERREKGQGNDERNQGTALRANALTRRRADRRHTPVAPGHLPVQRESQHGPTLIRERPRRVRRQMRAQGEVEEGQVGEAADDTSPSIRADPSPRQSLRHDALLSARAAQPI